MPTDFLTEMSSSWGPIADVLSSLVTWATSSTGMGPTAEDCLFLDVYVPAKAMKGQVKLPVINWIFGGAYMMGWKDGLYDGTPIVNASGGNVIYVTGNYRVRLP
jgi:carboxylesterase type B